MALQSRTLSPSTALHIGDALSVLTGLPSASIDAVVTDPPYAIRRLPSAVVARPVQRQPGCPVDGCLDRNACRACVRADLVQKYADAPMLGQQSQNWHAAETHSRGYADNDPRQFGAWCGLWLDECLRVLKPGGHIVAFGGTRTWHRLVIAAEDAGFEIRDSLAWLYSSGMPKSQNVARALTAAGGAPAAASWQGWGTALKPAFEPILLGRRPLEGTMVDNVRAWGVGPLNVTPPIDDAAGAGPVGKWPSNVHMDADQSARLHAAKAQEPSQFFWVSKPNQAERITVNGVAHPTVKPLDLMRRLTRLVTPVGGTVLDPFAGSGTTLEACALDGFNVIGIERDADYAPLIEQRLRRASRPAPQEAPDRDEENTLF
jgi:DNA modification methylase